MRAKDFFANLLYLVLAVALALLVQTFLIRPFIVSGNSMDPIIENKEYLIINEISYRFREPQRGEVVVFRAPPEPDKYYIKRVIGLPGETVLLRGTTVTIKNAAHPDGFTLDEPYLTHDHQSNSLTVTVPEGSYFVMGDNRDASYDSRGWGPLPKTNIKGFALLRLFPFSKITLLPGKETYAETN
ncbi:signal peptidase I [Candidatus Nomurabacteria bacterium]|nr:signal peptidase I [Candidatus Nomurabacteria bacterium]